MKWVKKQVTIIVTLAILFGGGLVTWGRMQQMCSEIERKADKEAIMRELDLIQRQLASIDAQLHGVIVRQAIITPKE
jgi:hypothetical protein